jgi:hypothetical protein
MPEIILKEPIYDEDAEQLQKCFTQGVIDLEDDNNGKEISTSFFFQYQNRNYYCLGQCH